MSRINQGALRLSPRVISYGRDTTTETLRGVFSQYGELEDAIVTVDRVTGKSKGYGFVTFRYGTSATAAVAEPEKQIDVRAVYANFEATVACGLASPGRYTRPLLRCYALLHCVLLLVYCSTFSFDRFHFSFLRLLAYFRFDPVRLLAVLEWMDACLCLIFPLR